MPLRPLWSRDYTSRFSQPEPSLSGSGEVMEEKLLSGLSLANIVLVDDARTPSPFLQDEEYDALRHCDAAHVKPCGAAQNVEGCSDDMVLLSE